MLKSHDVKKTKHIFQIPEIIKMVKYLTQRLNILQTLKWKFF